MLKDDLWCWTLYRWHHCYSVLTTNCDGKKLNNILTQRLIVSDAKAKFPDVFSQLIVIWNKLHGPVYNSMESSVTIEYDATLSWYRNAIAAVQCILQHCPLRDHIWDTLVKYMDSISIQIYAELRTVDWLRNMHASFHVLSESMYFIWCLICLRELH
jgi:hypothetical protein